MASSSFSQDDFEKHDFNKSCRRTKIRVARARLIAPPNQAPNSHSKHNNNEAHHEDLEKTNHLFEKPLSTSAFTAQPANIATSVINNVGGMKQCSHKIGGKEKSSVRSGKNHCSQSNDVRQSGPGTGMMPSSCNSKWKSGVCRDRRKLREKRRSSDVVHIPSTESAGGSSTNNDDDDFDLLSSSNNELTSNTTRFGAVNTATNIGATSVVIKKDGDNVVKIHEEEEEDETEESTGCQKLKTCDLEVEVCCSKHQDEEIATTEGVIIGLTEEEEVEGVGGEVVECDECNEHHNTDATTTPTSDLSKLINFLSTDKRSSSSSGDFISEKDILAEVRKVLIENDRLHSLLEEKDERISVLEAKMKNLLPND